MCKVAAYCQQRRLGTSIVSVGIITFSQWNPPWIVCVQQEVGTKAVASGTNGEASQPAQVGGGAEQHPQLKMNFAWTNLSEGGEGNGLPTGLPAYKNCGLAHRSPRRRLSSTWILHRAHETLHHGRECTVDHVLVHRSASHSAIPVGREAVGDLHAPMQRPDLPFPAAPRVHGLAFHWRDAATPPPGKRCFLSSRGGWNIIFNLSVKVWVSRSLWEV